MQVARVLISLGALALSGVAIASSDTLTEYSSLTDWSAAVSNVSSYQISQVAGAGYGTIDQYLSGSVTFGPGVFTPDTNSGVIYNDGLYGSGIQYFSDDPGLYGHAAVGSVTVAFGAADDISALAFNLGSGRGAANVDISVNGCALAPVVLSSIFPTMFFGVTDSSDSITSVTFTADNAIQDSEMDLINGYETATAAPEMSPASAPAALTLLFGIVAVLRSRRRPIGHTA